MSKAQNGSEERRTRAEAQGRADGDDEIDEDEGCGLDKFLEEEVYKGDKSNHPQSDEIGRRIEVYSSREPYGRLLLLLQGGDEMQLELRGRAEQPIHRRILEELAGTLSEGACRSTMRVMLFSLANLKISSATSVP